jgi:hypothetical protein
LLLIPIIYIQMDGLVKWIRSKSASLSGSETELDVAPDAGSAA